MTASTGDAAAPPATGLVPRFRRLIRIEDLLLSGWIVLVDPLVFPAGTAAGGSGPELLRGLLGLVALAGLAICVGARAAPGVRSGLAAHGQVAWVVGPLVGATAFALDDTVGALGIQGAGGLLLLGLLALGVGARLRLPPLGAPTRRALVTPFILVTSGYFAEFMSGLGELFDLGRLIPTFSDGPDASLAAFLLTMTVLGVLAFFVMLVFAPRQVAEREGGPLAWAARFTLYLASLVLGATWAGLPPR